MSRIAFALLPALSLAACGEPKCGVSECSVSAIADVRVESDRLVVELTEGERRYHLSCVTEVVSLARQDPSGGITPLATEHEVVADRFEGYWLDGEFVYPYFDEGCDVVECVELDEDPESGLIEYAVTGSDAPPDDLQSYIDTYGWGQEAAESVSVVESASIEGSIEVRLAYHTSPDCTDPEKFDSALIEI
jgi:hypothetical protein